MTIRDIAEHMLSFLEKDQRTIPVADSDIDDPLPFLLNCINGAIQEMAVLAPTFSFRCRRAAAIVAPVNITIPSVTAGAFTFGLTDGQGYQSWFPGCSFRIGSEHWNEISHRTSNVVTCAHPIEATGTNVSATVYQDSVSPASDVLHVMQPVEWADSHPLSPCDSLGDIRDVQYQHFGDEDFGFSGATGLSSNRQVADTTPQKYFVDSLFVPGAVTPTNLRIRLGPMPREAGILAYRARVKPTAFAMTDIYAVATPNADPGTEVPVPSSFVESIFLPVVMQRFQASPHFRNAEAKPEIGRQYQLAEKMLRAMRPQTRGARAIPGPG